MYFGEISKVVLVGGVILAAASAASQIPVPDLRALGAVDISGDGSDPYPADVNGDGLLDLVYSKTGPMSLNVHLNTGSGSGFAAAPVVSAVSGSEYFGAVALGDVTGDRRADAVIANANHDGKNVQILRGTASGGFVHFASLSNGTATTPGAALGDVNGDGALDLIGTTGSALSVMLNNGGGAFDAPIVSGVTTGPDGRFIIADINGDGQADAVFFRDHSPAGLDAVETRIRVHLGNGDGTFTLVQSLQFQTTLDDIGIDFVDGDGLPDLMLYGMKDNAQYEHRGGIRLLRNTGGQFEMLLERGWLLLPYPCESAELADLNGDGAAEVTLTRRSSSDQDVTIWVNDGNGTFPEMTTLSAREYGREVIAFDFAGSALKDLVVFDNPLFGAPDSYLTYGNETPSGTAVEAALVGLAINPGTRIAGNLGSLRDEDANVLHIRSAVTSSGAKWAQVTVTATSPELSVARLDVTTLARASMPGVTARVWLRNWDTNRWDLIDQFSHPTTETRKHYRDVASANAYIRDTDGRMQIRIRYSKLTDMFDAFINLVQFDVTR